MIEVKNINFTYPGSRHQIYGNLSVNFDENKIYGLLGKNGMGKSTLLYLIAGLLRPKSGEVLVDGIKSSIILCFRIHFRQTIKGSEKGLVTLGEVETNQVVHIHSRAGLAYP